MVNRRYVKKLLPYVPYTECFCIVPESDEEFNAEEDRSFLKQWANIPDQTHSLNVCVVKQSGQTFPETDALITFLNDTPIGVVTADCVPILLRAPDIHAVAAVHAGWKGSIDGILDHVLDEMERHGADLSKMIAVFGPSISKDVYEVDVAMGERFVEAGFGKCVSWPYGRDGKPHVDLQGVNTQRMLRRGVPVENIHNNRDCTYSDTSFHSYRRDGDKAGRQLSAIVMH